jgi:hypothetical protein
MKNYFYRLSFLFFFVQFFQLTLLAQNKFTISGSVRDKKSGESMIGASIKIAELPNVGTATNAYGFYSITLKEGNYTLLVTNTGYQSFADTIVLTANFKKDVELLQGVNLDEVTVSSRKKGLNLTVAQMGVEKLNLKEIQNIPVIFGEKDILKTIQLLPGIKSAGEGNSGFYVRGGGTDQNLILLDEAPVYNASHLLGFFSTFNSDAIKDIAIYKGGMPAQYGGRLSSVLDIKMNDGNNQEFKVSGGLGLISSRLNVEGPLEKGKSSFIVSGRRTYADAFLGLSKDSALKNNTLYFYDLNAKINFKINDKNRLYLSGYFGQDVLGFGKTFATSFGNATGTLRWNHLFSDKLFSNTSIIFSKYSYEISIRSNTDNFNITSKIQDVNFKQDFDWFLNDENKIRFGVNIIHHTTSPGTITVEGNSNLRPSEIENRYALESAFYFSNEWKPSEKFNMDYGIRFSAFSLLGPAKLDTYDAAGNITSTTPYESGKFIKTYYNFEPRLALNYRIQETSSIKASYSRNIQNLHLVSNSATTSPTDLWLPSSLNIKPEIADQVSLGFYKNFKDNTFEFSTEVYYKWLQNQIDYKDGADLIANKNVESELLSGTGRAYGIEFYLKKKFGRLNGWIGYTLSRVEKQIPGINKGEYYAARQDRTHDISIVAIYKLNERWTLSGTWVYGTGNAVSFPSGKYNANGQTTFYYTERNGYRMPANHRMDVGATLEGKKGKKFQSSWTFSIYNLYGRENPFTIEFKDVKDDPTKTEAVQTALFRWVPSVTWNFKF